MHDHQGRKADHLDLCATDQVAFRAKTTLLEDVELVHDALPELALDEVCLDTVVAGANLRAPIVIAAMTGGIAQAERVNRDLAVVAATEGLAMGFGSMRPMLEDGVTAGYLVRDEAPGAVLFGNLGVVQARRASDDQILDLIGQTGVQALCIHLNPAQEMVQPGGDRDFRGGIDTIARLVQVLPVPIIVKETGAGMSRSLGERLWAAGVRWVDVGGAGGTSWVGVETLRERAPKGLGERFWEWGIPTAASVLQLQRLGLGIIATGGVQTGLDVAKLVSLGAIAGGLARPFLQAHARGGRDGVSALARTLTEELRVACLLTGSRTPEALRGKGRIVGDRLARWQDLPATPLRGL